MQLPPLDDLVACPTCDTLHRAQDLPDGAAASCRRCHAVLLTSNPEAITRILSLAIAAVILLVAAISFPFLDLDVQGQHNASSVIGAILAFNDGLSMPLAFATALFIIVLPLLRLLALITALWPLVRGSVAPPHARLSFRFAEWLRPWAMGEIFMVGVAVALIKVAGLATVTIGPAFWAFTGVVVITTLKDQLICRYSIWEALDQQQPTA